MSTLLKILNICRPNKMHGTALIATCTLTRDRLMQQIVSQCNCDMDHINNAELKCFKIRVNRLLKNHNLQL